MQACPAAIDVAPQVSPSSDKLDLDHFFRDLLKYKPWLSAVAWEEFMKKYETVR